MKTSSVLTSLVLLATVVFIISCSKKDDPAPSKTLLLTQNTWKLTAVTYAGATIPGATFVGELLFKTDKTYSFSLSATIVGLAPIAVVETGTWAMASDEKSFTMIPNGASPPLTLTSEIIQLDASNLQFKQTVNGVLISYVFVKK